MSPDTIGAFFGGAIISGGAAYGAIRRLAATRVEKKITAISHEVGADDTGARLSDTVTLIHKTVNRIDERLLATEEQSRENGAGIAEIIETQKGHGAKLDAHEQRFVTNEQKHSDLAAEVAASSLRERRKK